MEEDNNSIKLDVEVNTRKIQVFSKELINLLNEFGVSKVEIKENTIINIDLSQLIEINIK